MKKKIHPEYYPNAKVICACGNIFTAGSTVKELQVEICSACHPFYTGKQKLVDAARRIEKFEARVEKKKSIAKAKKGRKAKQAKSEVKEKQLKTVKIKKIA